MNIRIGLVVLVITEENEIGVHHQNLLHEGRRKGIR